MKIEKAEDREERAIDALMAASLRQPEEVPITDEEVFECLKSKAPPSEETRAALSRIGLDAVTRLVRPRAEARAAEFVDPALTAQYAAMNRKNTAAEHDPKTEEELARKRKEILARLKKKRGGMM